MVEAFLAFARGEGGEAAEPLDPAALIEEIGQAARRRGRSLSLFAKVETPERPLVELRRNAIKRCLTNLVEECRRLCLPRHARHAPRQALRGVHRGG